jgi:hypothetical protein
MNRLGWRVLQWLAFPLFALALLLRLPGFVLCEVPKWAGRQLYRPFGYCTRRANGWRVVGGMWSKGAANCNRKVRR